MVVVERFHSITPITLRTRPMIGAIGKSGQSIAVIAVTARDKKKAINPARIIKVRANMPTKREIV